LAASICAYHLVLAAVALLTYRSGAVKNASPSSRLAIVIPAHNEETTIRDTLRCCAELDYPTEKYRVYVIADNCSDRTAEIAASEGAACLVRADEQRRGKGYALEWALPQVMRESHDAVVILDADCRLDSDALWKFDRRLAAGSRALQASVVIANPEHNALSYVLALANLLENDFFYAPKSALGMAVYLQGTGMVLSRETLLRYPWKVHTITEDADYSCQLLSGEERIEFARNVRVYSDSPPSRAQLRVQRSRWIVGGTQSARRHGWRLFWQGLVQRRPLLIDAGLTTWIVSRPLIIAQWLTTLALAVVCYYYSPDLWSSTLLGCSLAVGAGYAVYVGAGAACLGGTPRRVGLLFQAPAAVLGYLWMALGVCVQRGPVVWRRTPRRHDTGQGEEYASTREAAG